MRHKKHVHNVLHTNNVRDTQVCVIKTYEECGWGNDSSQEDYITKTILEAQKSLDRLDT